MSLQVRDNDDSLHPGGEFHERYDSIRSSIQGLDADTIGRQLPRLVESIARHSGPDQATRQFVVGVSFSQNETPLDYRLDRLVDDGEHDRPRLQTLKPPVSTEHGYLSFVYPPDPLFDAPALRGALLAAIENEFRPTDANPDRRVSNGADEVTLGTLLSKLGRQLGVTS